MSIDSEHKIVFENDRKTDGFDIFFWIFNDASSYVPTHWHTAIEFMYILEGEVIVSYTNKDIILLPGDSLLIDSKIPHSTKSLNGNKAILLQLPYEMLKKYIPDIDNLIFSYDCHSGNPEFKKNLEELITVILDMKGVFESKTKGETLLFNSLLFKFLFLLYNNFAKHLEFNPQARSAKSFIRLEPILDFTKQHYNEHITIQQISDLACMQQEYFCHYFKKNMGVTYLQYLNEIRLSHVYNDLSETNDTLQQILEKHGFSNYKLFRTMFYEQFHTTPGEYRKNLQQK